MGVTTLTRSVPGLLALRFLFHVQRGRGPVRDGAAWQASQAPSPAPRPTQPAKTGRCGQSPSLAPSPHPRAAPMRPGSPRGPGPGSSVGSMAWTPRRGWRAAQARPNEASPASRCAEPARASGNPSLRPTPRRKWRPTCDRGASGSLQDWDPRLPPHARGNARQLPPRRARPGSPGVGLSAPRLPPCG